jgi:hypothetical protein
MSLEKFGVVVTNIDCQKSQEESLSLKMMADKIQNVKERYKVALLYQNDVDPFRESRSTAVHRFKCTKRKQEKIISAFTQNFLKFIAVSWSNQFG